MSDKPTKETKSNEAPVLDITKLSSEQLAAIQKQLQERNKAQSANRGERSEIMVAMLKEKDENGEFINTTRDIAFKLAENGLCAILTKDNFNDEAMKAEVEKEIRKVQAKKQQLEKATNEKGELVHPEGTFGYKSSPKGGAANLSGKAVKAETVVGFFESGRVSELTKEQIALIKKSLSK